MFQARLKTVRVLIALLFLLSTVFIFLDFREHLPTAWIRGITWIQFLPSLIRFITAASLLGAGFILVLVLTALFGRVYCSAFCPLGILQDIISWLRKKSKKKFRYGFGKARNILRYGFLILPLAILLLGRSLLGINLLDPYSIFGRIASDLLQPLYTWSNNVLARLFESFDWYILYPQDVTPAKAVSYIIPAFMLGLLILLAFRSGRIYCNTVCPVGTLLGLLSRISVFRIAMLEETCTKCGKCAVVCKAQCIRVKTLEVDFSRCVGCFNCISTCPEDAIHYQFALKPGGMMQGDGPGGTIQSADTGDVRTQVEGPGGTIQSAKTGDVRTLVEGPGVMTGTEVTDAAMTRTEGTVAESAKSQGRREVLTKIIAAGTALGLIRPALLASDEPIENKIPTTIAPEKNYPVSPPGSLGLKHFTSRCTACHLCVSACPTGVLQPSYTEYGWTGLMQPYMDYWTNYCNFDCVRCAEVCPTAAILSLTQEAKKTLQIGKVNLILENCIPYTENTACGSCSEHCPTQAVTMVPHIDELTIPEIRPEICVGCGACEYACPTLPYKAIYVDGHEIHQVAEEPEIEELEKTEMEDFPF